MILTMSNRLETKFTPRMIILTKLNRRADKCSKITIIKFRLRKYRKQKILKLVLTLYLNSYQLTPARLLLNLDPGNLNKHNKKFKPHHQIKVVSSLISAHLKKSLHQFLKASILTIFYQIIKTPVLLNRRSIKRQMICFSSILCPQSLNSHNSSHLTHSLFQLRLSHNPKHLFNRRQSKYFKLSYLISDSYRILCLLWHNNSRWHSSNSKWRCRCTSSSSR